MGIYQFCIEIFFPCKCIKHESIHLQSHCMVVEEYRKPRINTQDLFKIIIQGREIEEEEENMEKGTTFHDNTALKGKKPNHYER